MCRYHKCAQILTHTRASHISIAAATHLHMCGKAHTCVTLLSHMYTITYSYACHDAFIGLPPQRTNTCDMTHSCVTQLIHVCTMTLSHFQHNSLMCTR